MTEREKLALLREALREIALLMSSNSATRLIAETALKASLR